MESIRYPNKISVLAKQTFVFIILGLFAACNSRQQSQDVYNASDSYYLDTDELALLSEGDLVFRLGYGLVSAFLERNSGGNGISHCGILVGTYPDFSVIHSISGQLADEDGVQICTLDEFLHEARARSFKAVRLKASDNRAIAGEAYRYLEERMPFDLKFDLKDTTKLFCSELIYRVLLNAENLAIFEEGKPDYYFNIFYDTTLFEPILDHKSK